MRIVTLNGDGVRPPGWRQAILVYRQPRMLSMLFLGFSAGLPFYLVFQTLSAWLRQDGIERATIGMLSWVGLVYSIKFVWAPVVDRLPLPGRIRRIRLASNPRPFNAVEALSRSFGRSSISS